ncbi:torsin-3A [Pelobates fuscus]|uniref:torsin-3A n=1 Tax=Pelobates fuscus TaxID=191477 RepID=UPI002FE43F79
MARASLLYLGLVLCVHSLTAQDAGQIRTGQEGGGQEDGEWFTGAHGVQDLAQLSWDYLQCWFSPEKCEESERPADWGWPTVGWESLQFLSDWYSRVSESGDYAYGRISNNLTGLQWDLSTRVHGQHLAKDLIVTSFQDFLEDSGPKKPLILSFHGWTGTGKNLVARIIAENLYEDGQRNRCIRIFFPQLHFPHASHLEVYKVQLEKQLRDISLRCSQPLFIFDDADKIPVALLTSIIPYITQSETQQTPSIFIFLSGLGSTAINEVALTFWRAGRHREEITADHLDRPLKASIRDQGDSVLLWHLVTEGHVDVFVPFLPLERAHVKLCARDSFVARGLQYTETALDVLTKGLLFVPKEEKLFSAQGCKLVAQRINFLQ